MWNFRFREPQIDLFDIELTAQEFKELGSGQIPDLPIEENTVMNTKYVRQRPIAIHQSSKNMNQVKPKLSSSNKNVSEDMLSTDAATRKRLEYEKVAEKLKTAFKKEREMMKHPLAAPQEDLKSVYFATNWYK